MSLFLTIKTLPVAVVVVTEVPDLITAFVETHPSEAVVSVVLTVTIVPCSFRPVYMPSLNPRTFNPPKAPTVAKWAQSSVSAKSVIP